MARETKAEREARELAEQQAEARRQRAAERKAAKEAEKSTGPQTLVLDFSDDAKAFLTKLFSSVPTTARQSYTQPEKEPIAQVTTNKAAAEAPKEATVTLTQIREAINAKAGENKTALIVGLLGNFGAKNASSLPEDSWSDFYNQLINL